MLVAVFTCLAIAEMIWLVSGAVSSGQGIGIDLRIMRELGTRWAESGTMYLPWQLTGPYSVAGQTDLAGIPGLYPPAAGPLFAVLAILPFVPLLVAWFVVPVAIVMAAVVSWRPRPWAWVAITAILALPVTLLLIVNGGTSMWAAAAVAAGLSGYRWAPALLLLKPTLAPFALIGIRSRSWWAMAAIIVVVTLAGPWQDYIAVARNAQGLDYTFWSYPLLLIPVIAWAGRRRLGSEELDFQRRHVFGVRRVPDRTG